MTILQELAKSEPIQNLVSAVKKPGRSAALFGVHKIHRTVSAAAFAMAAGRPVIFVCDSDGDAYRAAEDMRALGLTEVEALPSREVTLLDVEGISHDFPSALTAYMIRVSGVSSSLADSCHMQ